MIKTSTHNDIIRYLYGETSQEENETMKNEMIFNEDTRDSFHELVSVKRSIDKTLKVPSERAIESILNYSKSLNLSSVKKIRQG